MLLSLAIGSTGLGQAERTAVPEVSDEVAVDVEKKVPPPGSAIDLLRKPVAQVDWEEKPFEEVLDWLRDQGEDRINITARWGKLNAEGVDKDKPVTLNVTNTTIAEILEEVRTQLSDEDKIRYQASRNWLTISTKADFDSKLIRKIYYVGDLLFTVPDFQEEAPQIDLSGQNSNSGGSSGGGGGGGGGRSRGSVFQSGGGGGQGSQQGQNEQELEMRMERARNAIILTVVPDSWADTPTGQALGSLGGSASVGLGTGRIVSLIQYRSFVVLNTIEVHEELAGWFDRSR